MSEPAKVDTAQARLDEERLANALVGRGLVTREEVERCRADGTPGPEPLLRRLVEVGSLTKTQARRSAPRASFRALLFRPFGERSARGGP